MQWFCLCSQIWFTGKCIGRFGFLGHCFLPWVPEVFLAQRMEMAAKGRWHCTSVIETWPTPETAQEKPLAPRVTAFLQIRWNWNNGLMAGCFHFSCRCCMTTNVPPSHLEFTPSSDQQEELINFKFLQYVSFVIFWFYFLTHLILSRKT